MNERFRYPAVAGRFYPKDPTELSLQVKGFLGGGGEATARVLVVPHAGYMYSGAIAGLGYSHVQVPRRVLIMGPNHTGLGHPRAIWSRGSFVTPLGPVKVDSELSDQLIDCLDAEDCESAHIHEHSIEVQLPFLQFLNPKVQIAAVCLKHASWEECLRLGEGLASVLRDDPSILIVCSSDLSHFERADRANVLDSIAIQHLVEANPRALHDDVSSMGISMCGMVPSAVALVAANRVGRNVGRLLSYHHSGEVSGDHTRVVGYAAVSIEPNDGDFV